MWPSTVASIPSGWTRETTLDGKFAKATAAATNPNVTGGSDTHAHTAPTHTHTMDSHTHTGSVSANSGTEEDTDESGTDTIQNHSHNFTSSAPTGGNLVDAVSYASANGLPPYHELIFIKPSGAAANLAASIVAFFNSASVPTGWSFCNGAGGTPDLRNKYIRGAGTGTDAGTTGGSLTHSHVVDHTHTSQTHTHAGSTDASGDQRHAAGGGVNAVISAHTHVLTLDATSVATSAYSGSAGSADSVEPAYYKLLPIQDITGPQQPKGIIGMWLGTLASIPLGWNLCDGTLGTPDLRGKYIKCANVTGEIGDMGGANTHVHTASNSHGHTANAAHNHSASTSSYANDTGSGAGAAHVAKTHSHVVSSVSSPTSTYQNTTVTSDSSSNEPAYRTVAYLQFEFEIGAGILLL